MPDYKKLARGLNTAIRAAEAEASALQKMKGTQDVLPAAEREANKAKFLAESKDPRRMYHGTKSNIPQFIPSHKGSFVSPDPEFASDYSNYSQGLLGPNVMPVRVQVKNPFDYDNPAHMKAIREAASKRFPGNKDVQYEIDAIAGVDDAGTHLFETDPSGNYYEYIAMAIGARNQSAKTYLEKNYESFATQGWEELAKHGLRALKASA